MQIGRELTRVTREKRCFSALCGVRRPPCQHSTGRPEYGGLGVPGGAEVIALPQPGQLRADTRGVVGRPVLSPYSNKPSVDSLRPSARLKARSSQHISTNPHALVGKQPTSIEQEKETLPKIDGYEAYYKDKTDGGVKMEKWQAWTPPAQKRSGLVQKNE